MNVFRRIMLGATGAAVALGMVTLTGCSHKAPAAAAALETPTVATVQPTRQTITHLINQPAEIKSYERTAIYARVTGKVEKVYVDKGSKVHKDDILLTISVPEREKDLIAKQQRVKQVGAEIKQAEAALNAADANINTAVATVNDSKAAVNQAESANKRWDTEYVRAEELLVKGVFDKQTRDEARNQAEQAKAGVARAKAILASSEAALNESRAKREKAAADVSAAQAMLQVAEAQKDESATWLEYRNVRAPYDGIVSIRNVHTGAFSQESSSGSNSKAAEPLFVMVRNDIMRVIAQIPEYDAVFVKEGTPAVVTFHALPGEEFSPKAVSGLIPRDGVTLTSWAFDAEARTLLTECHLLNPDERLRPWMYGSVTMTITLPDVLTLPSAALMTDGDKTYCFVVEDGKAVHTNVKAGLVAKVKGGTGQDDISVTQVFQKQAKPAKIGKEGEWLNFTGQEKIVQNPTTLIDGQAVTVAEKKP
jgi:RND family efflux transporter MFP subunit